MPPKKQTKISDATEEPVIVSSSESELEYESSEYESDITDDEGDNSDKDIEIDNDANSGSEIEEETVSAKSKAKIIKTNSDEENDEDENVINDEDELIEDDDNTTNVRTIVASADRITSNILLKYERVRILGERTKQLQLGAKPMVLGADDKSPEEIAILELQNKTIPFSIERELPNGNVEVWKISELEIMN